MLQITPSFEGSFFFFWSGLNYLMMNSHAAHTQKKAGMTTCNLAPATKGKLWVLPPRWSLCPGTFLVCCGYCYGED